MQKATSTLGKGDFIELKSLAAPPQAVKEILFATLILLGENKETAKDWNFVKRQLACYGEKSILNRMMNRKAQEISSQSAQDASELLNRIDMARAHAVSSAIASVLAWCMATINEAAKEAQNH
ncbi:unnamed protein product [Clavelina lepadiformis]|uniref:Uncharacterized protein n=1 Tax=Clavelina lepadiformis TaxID=159417 RepID=A0ABP0FES1_CLALP